MGAASGQDVVTVRLPCAGVAGAVPAVMALLESGTGVELVVEPSSAADVGVVGALARLTLVARRSGAPLVLRAPDAHLRHLAELLGLCEALGLDPADGG